jgi:hypothetical protein
MFISFFFRLYAQIKITNNIHTFLHFLQVVEIFSVQTLPSRLLCPYLCSAQLHNLSAYILIVVFKVEIPYGSNMNNCGNMVSYLVLNFTIFTGFVICGMILRIHNRAKQLTLYLPTWRICWAQNNASKWQMGISLAFKGLN